VTSVRRGGKNVRILIAVASRHGSTHEIAEAIAQELRASGHDVDVENAGVDVVADPYGAVIVGSAVYMGNWLAEARDFVKRNRAKLVAVPVWLYSSGPVGQENPPAKADPNQLDELLRETGARGHRVFVGKLDKGHLGLGERLVIKLVKAPEGDFRDWEAIHDWAHEIAAALRTSLEPGV
jgi:menaquinone-dependent protoporphyrinogen oxidase